VESLECLESPSESQRVFLWKSDPSSVRVKVGVGVRVWVRIRASNREAGGCPRQQRIQQRNVQRLLKLRVAGGCGHSVEVQEVVHRLLHHDSLRMSGALQHEGRQRQECACDQAKRGTSLSSLSSENAHTHTHTHTHTTETAHTDRPTHIGLPYPPGLGFIRGLRGSSLKGGTM